jgi:hypothetical protein
VPASASLVLLHLWILVMARVVRFSWWLERVSLRHYNHCVAARNARVMDREVAP